LKINSDEHLPQVEVPTAEPGLDLAESCPCDHVVDHQRNTDEAWRFDHFLESGRGRYDGPVIVPRRRVEGLDEQVSACRQNPPVKVDQQLVTLR
jgi:hypothetical protein